MFVDWQQLLKNHEFANDQGSPSQHEEAIRSMRAAFAEGMLAPLPDTGIIKVSGADATGFLHTQLTQDMKGLADNTWVFAGYCNPKGRLLGLFRVLLSDDGILLLTRRELLEPLLKRLRMFVLRSKVVLEDVSDAYAAMGVAGPAALTALEGLVGSIREGPGHVHHAGDLHVLSLGGEPDRLMLLATGEDVPGIWDSLTRGVAVASPAVWTLLDIRAGWPEVYPQTMEAFVPQQVNLELIGGVNFKKGCYPGQEIVARMHYLGKPSRRMLRLRGPAGPLPAPGDKVTLGDGSNAGDVVHAAQGPDSLELLAVMHNKHRDRQDLDVGGVKVVVDTLPYAVAQDATTQDQD